MILFAVFCTLSANAQTEPPKVEITQETAEKCAKCFDEAAAMREEIAAKDEAIKDLQDEINRLRVELAQKTGELIGEKAGRVQDRAIIEFLLTNGRKKCGVLSICIQ